MPLQEILPGRQHVKITCDNGWKRKHFDCFNGLGEELIIEFAAASDTGGESIDDKDLQVKVAYSDDAV